MKYLWLFLLLACPVFAEQGPFPAFFTQGQLVYVPASNNDSLAVGDKTLNPFNNHFVFGVGREVTEPVKIIFNGTTFTVPVKAEKWPTDYVDGVPPETVQPPAKAQKRIKAESEKLAKARQQSSVKALPLCFIWPVEGRISGRFGYRRIYNKTITGSSHSGTDIAAPAGTPIKASADGVVVLAEPDLFYTGGTILIEHGSGLFSSYSHMQKLYVKESDKVKQGDVIGEVGATGRATGPHVHFVLDWQGVRVNPENVLKKDCSL